MKLMNEDKDVQFLQINMNLDKLATRLDWSKEDEATLSQFIDLFTTLMHKSDGAIKLSSW